MRVLVYADPGAGGDSALEWLAVLASAMPVQVTLLAAYQRVASGVTQLEPAVQFVRAHQGTIRVETIDESRAASTIVAEARRRSYDLIILPPSHGGARRLVRSSRVSTVVRSVGSGVLVVQPPVRMPQRILVCVGGGAHTEVDAEVAGRVAQAFGAHVSILHVVSQVPLVYSGIEDMRSHMQQFLASGAPAAKQLERAEVILADFEVPYEVRLREGIVVDEIMDEIKRGLYDLLVIGAHERGGGLLAFFLEDLSEDLTERSPISTLVVQGVEGWRMGAT